MLEKNPLKHPLQALVLGVLRNIHWTLLIASNCKYLHLILAIAARVSSVRVRDWLECRDQPLRVPSPETALGAPVAENLAQLPLVSLPVFTSAAVDVLKPASSLKTYGMSEVRNSVILHANALPDFLKGSLF
jgi:hypothetical protein